MPDEHHTWVVDEIEEDVAIVVEDGDRVRDVPRWLLPNGTVEGDILAVVRSRPSSAGALVSITLDAAATERARRGGQERMRPRNPADRGGDIAL